MAFLGERIETVVKTAREDGCWYSQGRPVFGDLLRCLRVCLDGYEGDGEECATRVLGGVIAVGRLIIVVRRIGGILLMGFTTGGDDFECIE